MIGMKEEKRKPKRGPFHINYGLGSTISLVISVHSPASSLTRTGMIALPAVCIAHDDIPALFGVLLPTLDFVRGATHQGLGATMCVDLKRERADGLGRKPYIVFIVLYIMRQPEWMTGNMCTG